MLLNSIQHPFSVIGLSETWLSDTNYNCYGLNGYNHFHVTRNQRKGGGLSIFIQNELAGMQRDDMSYVSDVMEVLSVEISKQDISTRKDVIISVVYRPPNTDVTAFVESLQELLSKVKKENKLVYLMGDFNINLLESESHVPTSEFLENLYSHSLFPMITKPTRVTSSSATLIDNIICPLTAEQNVKSGILFTDISDHFPVFSVFTNSYLNKQDSLQKTRDLSETNVKHFCDKLRQFNWDFILNENNGQIAFLHFFELFCKTYCECFPLKTTKNNYKNRIAWLTVGLKKSIAVKNHLYVKSKRNPSDINIANYKNYKSQLNKSLRLAGRQYYSEKIESNRNNFKKFWSVLKEVINKKGNCHPYPSQFKIGNVLESKKEVIANTFNKYFTNVGQDLAKEIPNGVKDPISYIPEINSHSMLVTPVDCDEVTRIIKTLKNTSAGCDEIHSKVVKATFQYYLEPLTHVLNSSLTQGFFPDAMKIARVVPIFKAGDQTCIQNYRPVSILPLFSKLFERLMYNRILKFISLHNILYKYQFGFREGYSTNMALIALIDKILEAIDSGEMVIGVLLDFKKAFDTVNHSVLLNKLYKYGIRGIAHKWLADYLNNRKQYVSFENVTSSHLTVKCGVPQGSILGPLLFKLYINDIIHVSNVLLPIIYADDTNVFIKGKSVNAAIELMNNELAKIVEWLNSNKLSLNIEKTQYMIFRSVRRKILHHNNVKINNTDVICVDHAKFIGVTLDDRLSWQHHINNIKKKVSKGIGILCKARKSLPQHTLVTLYNSLIYCHLTYCIEVWGNASDIYVSSLFKLQKKVVRIIQSAKYNATTDNLFKELKFLKLSQITVFCTVIFMFKFVKGIMPDLFYDMFKWNSEVSSRETRQSNKLRNPCCKTSILQRSIRNQGVLIWNDLNEKIGSKCSVHTFKRRVKSFLIV